MGGPRQTRVKAVVLFGELADFLRPLLEEGEATSGEQPIITKAGSLGEAVVAAWKMAQPGDVVLLAPGGTSFDGYIDFAERGEDFRRSVRNLPLNTTGGSLKR